MRIKKISFHHYKAFKSFFINLSDFDVLVGPNNAGKSTVLGALRILSEGLRKANAKKAERISAGVKGFVWAYRLDLDEIPVSLENVFYDYDETEAATIIFELENKNRLTLFFPQSKVCYLIPEASGAVNSPTIFRKSFPIKISHVPVLGPVEHNEILYQPEAARKALLTHRASRNFRNIWYHFKDGFEDFREKIRSTWPGMDIKPPEIAHDTEKPRLFMFCPEERIDREIYWAGFGFQVWCQMLTFILQAKDATLLIIDEPDIYLHSDLQRQLVGILLELDLQIIIATHSIEIITEVETRSLLTINKKKLHATRVTNTQNLQKIYQLLGSNANPVLTQLAKTRRVLYLEGKDFQLLSLFARKLGYNRLANRSDFAVVPVEGFNPQKVKNFSRGMELTLETPLLKCVVFDRDYRNSSEIDHIGKELQSTCEFVIIHRRKEIENFLLQPVVLNRAISAAIKKRQETDGVKLSSHRSAEEILNEITEGFQPEILAQYLKHRRQYVKQATPREDESTSDSQSIREFDKEWKVLEERLKIVPGKDTLSALNKYLQEKYKISLTSHMIIESFVKTDIDSELLRLIVGLKKFSETPPPMEK
ncbi:MAG: AAA family ATPase [bacterium]|nr:AAA family ATPase [bacterium]